MAIAMKHMALNFAKRDKFEGVDFKRWQKKMNFLLFSMSVVYVLNTLMPKDGGDNPTVEQRIIELGSHLRIEESLRAQDNDKPKGNNVAGPSVVNVRHNNSSRYNDNRDGNVGNKANRSGTKGSVDGSSNSPKGQNMSNKSLQVYYVTYVSEAYFVQDDDVAWWVKSGATMHVCKDRCWFKTYESLNDGSILHMGNESTSLVHGCGCVDLRLNIVSDNIGSAFMSTSKLNYSIILHARLGHVHFKRMQDIYKDGLILAFDMDTENCKTCMLNKITKKLFQNVKRKTEVLELINSNLCDLHATPSLGNKKYFVTFIDDASRFCYVYLLHTKDEALDEYKVFKTEVELQQGSLIKRFRTDRGGEYMDTLYFQSVGIIHETTAPYTPQQNGISKRKNMILKEMVNSMLSYSGLSQGLSGEAMLTACCLLNWVPNKRNRITPYELWTKKKPNLNYLKVWGCRAVVRLLDPKLKTLGERGIECIFVGYAEHSKAFRFYVIEPNESVAINSIIDSKHAIFDEYRFSSVHRPSQRSLVNGTEDSGGSMVPEKVTDKVVQQPEPELRKSKRHRTPKDFRPEFQLYLIEGTRDEKEAINDEMDSIMGNNTWVLTDLPPGCRPLGIDYFDTYAPVARISTIRLLIAMTSIHNMIIHQMDVKTAFLNGELDEEVDLTKEFLSSRFSIKDMRDAYIILDIRIKHKSNGLAISQSHYIEKVLKKFNYFDCTPVSTPIDTSEKLMPNNGQVVSQLEYSRVIGYLMYAMTCTRPDIAFAVGKLSRYTSNPGTQYWQAIQRVLKYLKKTMDYRLMYTGYPSVLEGYTDARWISITEDNSSTSGWVFLLGGGAISWASKK
ncbi:zinc finger, CCHC-type containing protein [Tanacetum coccineum]|uniref:Zinc finger, CCHC-type containing protein n=1 Tax=Tanacetum coccineum TaxID=301880 RepID=A0ABQ5DB72_9ASTR